MRAAGGEVPPRWAVKQTMCARAPGVWVIHASPCCYGRTWPGDTLCMLPLVVRRAAPVKDAPRPSAASAADSVGVFLSWCLCIHPVSLPGKLSTSAAPVWHADYPGWGSCMLAAKLSSICRALLGSNAYFDCPRSSGRCWRACQCRWSRCGWPWSCRTSSRCMEQHQTPRVATTHHAAAAVPATSDGCRSRRQKFEHCR